MTDRMFETDDLIVLNGEEFNTAEEFDEGVDPGDENDYDQFPADDYDYDDDLDLFVWDEDDEEPKA